MKCEEAKRIILALDTSDRKKCKEACMHQIKCLRCITSGFVFQNKATFDALKKKLEAEKNVF